MTHGSEECDDAPADFLPWRQAGFAVVTSHFFRLANEDAVPQAAYWLAGNEDAFAISFIREPGAIKVSSL